MTLQPGDRVAVYRNLHKGMYSVVHKGRVVAHMDTVYLTDVQARVSEAGRVRVLRDRVKNVHAKLVGRYALAPSEGCSRRVTYNPYLRGDFYFCDDGAPFLGAGAAVVGPEGVFVTPSGVWFDAVTLSPRNPFALQTCEQA